jgi:hypothetical protein
MLDMTPTVGIAHARCTQVDETGKVLGLDPRTLVPITPERIRLGLPIHHLRMMRREVYEQAGGFNPDLEYGEDLEFSIRLALVSRFQLIPKSLYFYRIHPGQTTQAEKELFYQGCTSILQDPPTKPLEFKGLPASS